MPKKAVVVLIGGGHRAGKRTVCDEIKEGLKDIGNLRIEIIELDGFLLDQCGQNRGPARFNFGAVFTKIDGLQRTTKSADQLLVLIPGLYALFDRELRQISSMKVFVDCDADTRLNRWIEEDVLGHGKDLGQLLDYYLKSARPEFNEFIQPTKEFADVILPSEESRLGISLICDGLSPLVGSSKASASDKQVLFPRFGVETDLDIHSERFEAEKNKYYDLN